MEQHARPITAAAFGKKPSDAFPLAVLTAYDYPSAALADEAGVDAVLVGDSLGMVIMGHANTLGVTMDIMAHHTAMVARATRRALVIADMPFLSCNLGPEEAARNAGRLVGACGAGAVKIEGSMSRAGDAIQAVLRAGIPVMGHLGLTPQRVLQLGGYHVQGRDEEAAARIRREARELAEAGCFAVVLECVPADLAKTITSELPVPTIGIGAGPHCDGQVLVMHDILGWGKARFARTYADVRKIMGDAFAAYVADVKAGRYPAREHWYE
ncbi:MAG TPA: 3-methyl-2-oxobutanoate hydroxymethyltransferase [Candidatus Hydrogenedentes bacterium]|nr:3-methyl-2-oxobutanoate hydroxymethyltransferase [Candidatus Hydrogenedentota bacterium]